LVKFYVAVTDNHWFRFLAERQPDEVNFWRPKATTGVRAISQGEPFLFKLHSPHNYIAGGGFFVRHSLLPLSLAWEAFGEKNGASSFLEVRNLVNRRRGDAAKDPVIGCTILTEPFFFAEDAWIPAPEDWKPNIVSGKTYNTSAEVGRRIWDQVVERLTGKLVGVSESRRQEEQRFGSPVLVRPRLGQGGFRISVTEAYARRCAATGERTLPVLQAAHIKPFAESGPHQVRNGLLLRSDLHILFDHGYVTVDEDHRLVVSKSIREDFDNGREYYAMSGRHLVSVPSDPVEQPGREFLSYHNEKVFRGN